MTDFKGKIRAKETAQMMKLFFQRYLVRKALSFSKVLENHIGAIKYFFYQYNFEQQAKWDKYESAHL